MTKQLMANLVLLGATRLHRLLLTATGEEVAEFNHFVVYGCQLSPVHSLKLLKLAIDFDKEALTFYELFQLPVTIKLPSYGLACFGHCSIYTCTYTYYMYVCIYSYKEYQSTCTCTCIY